MYLRRGTALSHVSHATSGWSQVTTVSADDTTADELAKVFE